MRIKCQNTLRNMRFYFLITIIAFSTISMFAQDENNSKISSGEKKQVIDSIARFMTDYYVFPDKGKEMGDLPVRERIFR